MRLMCVALALACAATPAMAGDLRFTPVPAQGQTVRYDRGHPTVEDDLATGAIRVMPIDVLDHGSFQFMVVAYNKGDKAVNVGVENIALIEHDIHYACLTKDELEHKAKNRAMWSQIGYAMLAGAAAASQNNDTRITSSGPWGVSQTVIHRPGLSNGQIATVAAGGGAIALSQVALEKKLHELNDEIVQTSTIDPGQTYGGRIVVQKVKDFKLPGAVALDVEMNGTHHVFAFNVSKS